MDFDIDRRELLKATGAGLATVTVTSGTAGAVTDLADLPGDGTEGSPYEIETFDDLLAIDQDLTANYVLTDNVEFNSETPVSPLAFDSSGYGATDPFLGTLDGQGYEIRNLQISSTVSYSGAGLFGSIGDGGVVRNLALVNIDVTSDGYAGGLVGVFDGGTSGEITNVSVTGSVGGAFQSTGGLIGEVQSGTVSDCSSTASVLVDGYGGGLIGLLGAGEVTRSYAKGDVGPSGESGGFRMGGFVGYMNGGTVTLSFASGNAFGERQIGGFVGSLTSGSVEKAYARGSVGALPTFSPEYYGGFAGDVDLESGSVKEAYSTGQVSGPTVPTGGLVGSAGEGGELLTLSNHVTDAYWDEEASGLTNSNGGTGLTTDQMTGDEAPDNMTGFDFDNTWVTITGDENVVIDSVGSEISLTDSHGGDGYPVFGWQVDESEGCIKRRSIGRGQEDQECPDDRELDRGDAGQDGSYSGRGGGTSRRGGSRRGRGR